MTAHVGLTLKHVHEDGNVCYVGATSVELVWPKERPCFLRIEAGDDGIRREAHTGRAYLINSAGKTIEVFTLNQIAPQPEPA